MNKVNSEKIFNIASESNSTSIYLDKNGDDYEGLKLIAKSFVKDVNSITGQTPKVHTDIKELGTTAIIAGSIGNNQIIDSLISNGKIDVSNVKNKWEVYKIDIINNPIEGVNKAIVITGSDKRGTIYGIYRISELMGVSPWVYWGDVEPQKRAEISLSEDELITTSKEPSVKYRGIFINDEQPSIDSWARLKFGGFNEDFYELVFELILRLKGNYLWPAMWAPSFSMDGKSESLASAKLAHTYGIVMGTSHHEPLMRAGIEWRRLKKDYYGNAEWKYDSKNKGALQKFWDDAVKRNASFENIITLGIRGEEDSLMLPPTSTVEDNVNLLKEIIIDQKQILADNNLTDAPTMLTIYKEVEEFWHGKDGVEGLKHWEVLDDVIIMLAEDNFGNMRTLPTEDNKNRQYGWGMYYHFDYHGGPVSFEWVNSSPLAKTWEQMSTAYDYGINKVWIVNVGDLKPMELSISFFLDMAYDFDKYGVSNIDSPNTYVNKWVKQQFDNETDEEGINNIVYILNEYLKINGTRKPEIMSTSTYHVTNYNEAITMLKRVDKLIQTADDMKSKLSDKSQAAYYQLVYYPAVASANVVKMHIYSALNELYYSQGRATANLYANLTDKSIELDKELQHTYNINMPNVGNRWERMMSSPHVGFKSWNSDGWSYPPTKVLDIKGEPIMLVGIQENPDIFKSGNVNLPDFTILNKEVYTIDIANGGSGSFNYSISVSNDWIKLTKDKGVVEVQDSIEISVDYDKITKNSTGTVTITDGKETVIINVKVLLTDTSGLNTMTFIEAHNFISIEASHYSDKVKGTKGEEWEEIKNYGKTLSSMKVFPYTKSFDNPKEAPYLEYKIKVTKSSEYTLKSYIAPSNNVDWNKVTMRYGICIDDGAIDIVETLSPDFTGGKGYLWNKYVMDNIRITDSKHTISEGVHTIRLYSVDPTLVLQKLVLFRTEDELKPSYFGPPESYYVGKK